MSKNQRASLFTTIPLVATVPLMIFGIVIMIVCSIRFSGIMYEKVESELKSVANCVLTTYDLVYPGDYHLVTGGNVAYFYKGEEEITGNFEIIDRYSADTHAEISIFYKDTRMLTTLKNSGGERLIGTGANTVINQDVVDGKREKFYNRVNINNVSYYAYYSPILLPETGGCVGMIAIAKPTKEVNSLVMRAVAPVIIVESVFMIIAALVAYYYAKSIARAIHLLQKDLSNVAKGELSKEPNYEVMKRKDEIGEMGKSVLQMQRALHNLVERDALTELYNRRLANKKLDALEKNLSTTGMKYCVAIGDIDFFKKVNDTYGHEAGDDVLKETAKILRKGMTGNGFVARWGGEEFLLVFENMEIAAAAGKLLDILNEIRAQEVVSEGVEGVIKITMSFGIVQTGENSTTDEIIRLADQNLYEGKTNGRNRIISTEKENFTNEWVQVTHS